MSEKIMIDKIFIEASAKKNLKRTLLISLFGIIPIIIMVVSYIYSFKFMTTETLSIFGSILLGVMIALVSLPFVYSIVSEIKLSVSNYNKIKENKYRVVEEIAIAKDYPVDKSGKTIKRLMLTMKDKDGIERKVSAKATEYANTEVNDKHYTVFIDEQDYYFISFPEKYYIFENNT